MLFGKTSLMLSCLIMLMLAGAVVPGDAQAETKIAFAATGDGNGEVYVMDADGSNQTNLTNHPFSDEVYCTLSPDGSQVAFVSDQDNDAEI
ncbi:MAG: hypothetical protein VCC68_12395, partial [Myxococcota bacterium]